MDAFFGDFAISTPGPTFPSRLPMVPLDRVIHSHNLRARTHVADARGHPHASDHLPIVADIHMDQTGAPK